MDENFSKQLGALFGNAREMQEKMETAQKEIAQLRETATAGGGLVTVAVSGERRIVRIEIDDSVMNDRDMLQDLLVAASNDALRKIEAAINEKMQRSLLGGLGGLGGMGKMF